MVPVGSMQTFSEWRVPVLRRFAVRTAVEYGVLTVAAVTLDFGPRFGWWSLPGGWLPPFWLVLACEIVWIVSILVRWRRVQWPIIKRARATGGRVCPQCGYDLLALDQRGTCPECGEAFSPKSLRCVWRR